VPRHCQRYQQEATEQWEGLGGRGKGCEEGRRGRGTTTMCSSSSPRGL
jgi:hypothetical protein